MVVIGALFYKVEGEKYCERRYLIIKKFGK
jgi:hypothetical protein